MQRFFDAVNKGVVSAKETSSADHEVHSDHSELHHPPDKIVLVVDDDSLMRGALCEHLRLNDFSIMDVATTAEGYSQVLKLRDRVSLLITDMVLPGGGGWQLVQSARRVIPDLAVIFISGAIDEQVVTSASSHPRTGFLEKPFEFKRLTDLIRALLSEKINRDKFACRGEMKPKHKAG
jgi:DNA-binding NtrC family response regulator